MELTIRSIVTALAEEKITNIMVDNVYIIDDDSALRMSVRNQCQHIGFETRSFAGGRDFLDARDYISPGCLLLDLRMPDITGLQVLEHIYDMGDKFKTVVMTGHGQVETAVDAMRLGAVDYLTKPFTLSMLESALRRSFAKLRDAQAQSAGTLSPDSVLPLLTDRQRAVLQGMINGRSNKDIAANLGISLRTVEMHRAHLMAKLGVRNLPALLQVLGDVRSWSRKLAA